MNFLSFVIGWLFHEDYVQEQEELQREQEEEMRIRQEEEDNQNWDDMMQAGDDQFDDR